MLWKRLLSALFGVPVIIFAVWYGGFLLLILTGLLYFLGLIELLKMFSPREPILGPVPAFIGGGIFLYSTYVHSTIYSSASLTIVLMIFLLSILVAGARESLASISITFLSTVYMALINYIYLLRDLPGGLTWIIFLLTCIWINDTAAYFGGKKFGRSPLAREISPGKTREGAIFGVLGSLLIAYVFTFFVPSIPVVFLLVLGFSVAIAGQVGDLVESAIKREVGVKDSGNLIPGHGGVLDRFDSMLLGAPLVYYSVSLFIIS